MQNHPQKSKLSLENNKAQSITKFLPVINSAGTNQTLFKSIKEYPNNRAEELASSPPYNHKQQSTRFLTPI